DGDERLGEDLARDATLVVARVHTELVPRVSRCRSREDYLVVDADDARTHLLISRSRAGTEGEASARKTVGFRGRDERTRTRVTPCPDRAVSLDDPKHHRGSLKRRARAVHNADHERRRKELVDSRRLAVATNGRDVVAGGNYAVEHDLDAA